MATQLPVPVMTMMGLGVGKVEVQTLSTWERCPTFQPGARLSTRPSAQALPLLVRVRVRVRVWVRVRVQTWKPQRQACVVAM